MTVVEIVNALSWTAIALGSFFVVTGAVGLLRMPDVYTRMHAASVIDTMGAGLIIVGLIMQAGLTLITLKLVFILALLLFTGPVAAHALVQAALHERIEPKLDHDRRAYSRHVSGGRQTDDDDEGVSGNNNGPAGTK